MLKKGLNHIVILFLLIICLSCNQHRGNIIAFYYWKTDFHLPEEQRRLIKQVNATKLYIHFFDVQWDSVNHQTIPKAIVNFHEQVKGLYITPVIYITNKTFEKITITGIDSLAIKCQLLTERIAVEKKIEYSDIQIDCDWNLNTRDKYFKFLLVLKRISRCAIEATIRLHQVKYRNLTGVPPANRGILMFYNMGHINANPKQPNSIYNYNDAEKYLATLGSYPLPLDIALPAFSWVIQIRNGRVIQVYGKITHKLLDSTTFVKINNTNCYIAKESFFWKGIYIKQSDIFKLEAVGTKNLNQAAQQLSKKLSAQNNRSIIFYELANLNSSEFDTNTIKEVFDNF